jgi:hypothetical protein
MPTNFSVALKSCPNVRATRTHVQGGRLWLGLSPPVLTYWKTIGEHADELIGTANKLPNAWITVYQIASLPAETRTQLLATHLPTGEHADELISTANKLPNSWFTVAQIASLPAETRLG